MVVKTLVYIILSTVKPQTVAWKIFQSPTVLALYKQTHAHINYLLLPIKFWNLRTVVNKVCLTEEVALTYCIIKAQLPSLGDLEEKGNALNRTFWLKQKN